ncbi:MAG: hypothetical protein D6738_10680, partial [Acidobacteria bacterium]
MTGTGRPFLDREKGPRRTRRRAAAAAGAVLLAVAALGLVLVSSPWFGRQVAARLAARAAASGAILTIDGLRLAPLSGALRADRVAVEGPPPLDRLETGAVRVRLSRRELLRGRLRVLVLEVDRPEVEVALPAPAGRPGGAPSGADLDRVVAVFSRVGRIDLRDGELRVADTSVPFSLSIEDLRLASRTRTRDRLAGDASLARAELALGGRAPVRLGPARAGWSWDGGALRLDGARLEARPFAFEADAALDLAGGAPQVDATVRGQVDLAWLAGTAAPVAVQGRAALALDLRWRPGSREIVGLLERPQGVALAGRAVRALTVPFRLGPSGLAVRDAAARLDDGVAVRDVDVGWQDGRWTAGGVADLPVAALLAEAGLPSGLAGGVVEARIDAAGEPGQAPTWNLAADVRPDGDPAGLSGRLVASMPGGARFAGRWAGAEVAATLDWDGKDARLAPWRLTGRLDAARPDDADRLARRVPDLLRALGVSVPAGVDPALTGPAAVRLEAGGRGARLDRITLGARVAGLVQAGRPVGDGELSVAFAAPGRWTLAGRLAAGASGRGALFELTSRGDGSWATTVLLDGARVAWFESLLGAFGVPTPEGLPGGQATGALRGEIYPGMPRCGIVARADLDVPGAFGVPVHASGWGSAAIRAGTLGVRRLALSGPGLEVSAAGTVRWPDPATGWAAPSVAGDVDARVELAMPGAWISAGLVAGGRVAVRGSASVEAGQPLPALDGEAGWHGVVARGLALPDGSLRVSSGTTGLALGGHAGPIGLAGRIRPADGGPRLDLQARWDDVDLVGLAARILRRAEPPPLLAPSSGRAALEGPLGDPLAWHGQVVVERLALDAPQYRAELVRPARLALGAGGVLAIPPDAPPVFEGAAGERLSVSGRLGLAGADAGRAALAIRGEADLSLVEALDPDLVARGLLAVDLGLEGALDDPRWSGRAHVERARIRHLGLREALDDVTVDARLDGDAVVLDGAARIGGGSARLDGSLRLAGWLPAELDVRARLDNVAVSSGRDLWGRYRGELRLSGPFARPLLGGTLEMLDGRYTAALPLAPTPFGRARSVEPGWGPGTLPDRLRLDVTLRSDYVLSIVNDQADLVAALDLSAEGRLADPVLSGTVTLLEGGRIRFRGVEYEVLAGQVILDERRTGVTRLRLRATTDVAGYRIELELDATEQRVDYRLRSLPALSEADILALLLTGQRLAESDSLSAIGSDLAATYFGSSLGELLLAPTARRWLGLSEFRIGTARLGPEARPTARVTLGRRLDERTLLLYSRDLTAEGRDLYRVERELSRSLRLAVGRESLGGVSGELRWIRRLGEARPDAAEPRLDRLDGITWTGWPADVDRPSRRELGLRRGIRLTPSLALRAGERAEQVLVDAGYLAAEVRTRIERSSRSGRSRLVIEAEPGARWSLRVIGTGEPARIARRALVELWAATRFRDDAFDEAERVVADRLAEEGWATALVEIGRDAPEGRTVRVEVDPGPRVVVDRVDVEGVRSLPPAEVRGQLLLRPGRLGLSRTLYRPRAVADDAAAIEALYVARGFLDVTVTPRVRLSPDGRRARVTHVVDEGRRYLFAPPRIEGEWPEDLGPATRDLPLRTGEPFEPEIVRRAAAHLRGRLDEAGFHRAQVDVEISPADDGTVRTVFRVVPGRRAVVGQIVIRGLERTKRKVVERALAFREGEPLTGRAVAETERRLFRLGVFRRAAVHVEPIEADPGRQRVIVEVEELPPISFLGSIGWDTEEKLRASAALSHENLFGRARIGSLQGFGSSLRRGLRATLEDRQLFGGRLEGLLATGGEVEERDGFTLRTLGASAELATPERRKRRWVLRYQLDRTRVSDVTLDTLVLARRLENEGIPADTEWLSGVIGAFIIDRRDDPFLPGAGWLARTEAGVWLDALGSDASFARWSGQLAGYRPLGRDLTLAGSIRVGVGWPLGGTRSVPISQRFFAGGADTVRGFARDRLGPEDPLTGLVLGGGGEAEWINNLELRWHVTRQLDLALFHDSGNVWATAGLIDPGDLRQAIGLGLRWRSPVGLLRLEYGRKLAPRPGESRGELFLAIG